jgi:hypothetical protein
MCKARNPFPNMPQAFRDIRCNGLNYSGKVAARNAPYESGHPRGLHWRLEGLSSPMSMTADATRKLTISWVLRCSDDFDADVSWAKLRNISH